MKHLLLSILLLVVGAQSTLFAQTEPEISTDVEVEAAYPGGNQALFKFILEHLTYPQSAIELNLQGKIFYRFVVEKDGSVSNIKVVKSIDLNAFLKNNKIKDEFLQSVEDTKIEMEKAGMAVIKSFPKFKPATIKNQPVRCYFVLPLNFTLN